MNFKKTCFFVAAILFGLIDSSFAENTTLPIDDLSHYCQQMYQTHGSCPEEICSLGCVGGMDYQGCPVECQAKPCIEIDAEHCPQTECDLIEGCDKKKVCYYKISEPPDGCGDLSYVGASDCCEGFVKRCGIEFFDGSCDMTGQNSIYCAPMCIPCGNGICNQFENRCNCPEDCR